MMVDTVSDFLTRIRNAAREKHKKVDVSASKIRVGIAEIFKKNGFIRNYKLFRDGEKGVLRIYLRYTGKEQSVIHGLQRVSRPSRRVYVNSTQIPKVLGGLGVAVLSTSQGVISDEIARQNKVGGEVICSIW